MSDTWTIQRVLGWATEDLAKRASPSPRLDAELMLAEVLACDRIRLITDSQRPLAADELDAYKRLHKRRRSGEPIAYLCGTREFFSRSFVVDGRVMVPRPETEHLVEVVMRRTRRLSLSARILDVCTGSGCVAITLKKERPTNDIWAGDVSADALAVARHNADRLGALVAFRRGDLLSLGALPRFDTICANPPYIPSADLAGLPADVRDFEPRLALDGGEDGLDTIRQLIATAPAQLRPGGVVALEIEAGSSERVGALFEDAGYGDIHVERDYAGHDRIVSASWRR